MKSKILLTLHVVCTLLSNNLAAQPTIIAIQQQEFEAQLEQQLKDIYLCSFKTIYSDYWTASFESSVVTDFETYMTTFKNSNELILLIATHQHTITGWALYYKNNLSQQAILELICVNPLFWRQGIGKELVVSIKTYWPEVKSIAVVTRKINTMSPSFYESLGFKKSNFILPEYPLDDMQGYELEFNH